ncbi:MAG: RNA-binding S4 domain-containing protein [Pyrinomonadaceae bacterium]
MRLDLFLKASRLCPRRTIAQKLCDAGLVFINDRPAKAGHAVKSGDEVMIRQRDRVTKVRVRALPTARQTSRQEASALFEVLSEELLASVG